MSSISSSGFLHIPCFTGLCCCSVDVVRRLLHTQLWSKGRWIHSQVLLLWCPVVNILAAEGCHESDMVLCKDGQSRYHRQNNFALLYRVLRAVT